MTSAAPKDFNKTRAVFMQNISGANIPPLAFKLSYLLVYRYANHKTQLCYPSQTTLAADLGVSIRTIQRLLDILERHGLVIAPGDGRGKSSRYWIDPERVTPVSSFTGQKGDKKGRHPTTKKGDTGVTRTKKGTNIGDRGAKAPPVPLEREIALTRDEFTPARGGPAADAATPEEVFSIATETPPEPRDRKGTRDEENELAAGAEHHPPSEPSVPIVPRDDHGAFHDLREIWDRGHLSDDTPKAQALARQAFERACRDGADPAEIIAGARVHVAAADAPKYLTALPTWLAAKGWTKQPPKKPHRGRGGVSSRSNGNGYAKPDMFKIALEAGGYRADANGNLYWPGDGGGDDDDAPLCTSMWGGGQ